MGNRIHQHLRPVGDNAATKQATETRRGADEPKTATLVAEVKRHAAQLAREIWAALASDFDTYYRLKDRKASVLAEITALFKDRAAYAPSTGEASAPAPQWAMEMLPVGKKSQMCRALELTNLTSCSYTGGPMVMLFDKKNRLCFVVHETQGHDTLRHDIRQSNSSPV